MDQNYSIMNNSSRTQIIAKNTILLYFRSIVVMLLSIYTSRVLLSILGVEDYGLYNVVGGVVALFLSFKSIFAASVQRFINFEKGKGNEEKVNEIFNTSVIIHICIAILFVVVVEICGLLYIPSKMVMPDGMLNTALFVFHCSVLATSISIFTIPYDAVIIANERMNFYALQAIVESALKLIIVICIPLFPFEKLKTYAVLVLLVSLLMRIMSVQYSKRFPECKKKYIWNKNTVKQLSSFASWNILGCSVSSIIEEGSNFVINAFGGVGANAARGIAYQVRNAIMSLSNNIIVASQPFIVQKAASSDRNEFWSYIFKQSKFMFLIVFVTVLPIFIYAEKILEIWLTVVPENAAMYIRTVLIYMIVMSFQKSLDLAFKSYNKMPLYQIIDAIVCLTSLPICILTLKLGAPIYSVFIVFSIIRCVDYICIIYLAKMQLGLKISDFCKQVLFPALKSLVVGTVIVYVFSNYFIPNSIWSLLLYIILVCCLSVMSIVIIALTRKEKTIIFEFINNKIRK